ncbi:MAG TPA: hypothetical protein VFU47_06485 [Armatimonadota bacterium]|nr:hypothetical protein [Armatimonadota bacterium]
MRIGRDSQAAVHPADVAWVAEWQLACALPWVPLDDERTVTAAPEPDRAREGWPVEVRVGTHSRSACLPLADLLKVVAWCRRVRDRRGLERPPAVIRRSLLALQAALRSAVSGEDPLDRMGYACSE